jgi:uncharacterized protein YqjF (DUF2071 family)
MALSLVAFSLTSAAYTDVSEGFAFCAFRLPFISQKNNVIRVHLGTSLPTAETIHFDEYLPTQSASAPDRALYFNELSSTNRVYVRAAREALTLKVYRA